MKRNIIALALFALMAGSAQAQGGWFGVGYSTAFGTGKLSDYIQKYSWRGFSLEYKGMIHENFMFGITTGLNVFEEKKDYDSYTYQTITLTGTQFRYTSACPILLSGYYHGESKMGLHYYAGLGLGTTYLYRQTDFGSYSFQRETWQFLLTPEAGLWYPIIEDNLIFLSLKYHNNFKNNELDGQSYMSVNLGWAWSWGNLGE